MPRNNGHGTHHENGARCVSLQDLLRPLTSPNGAGEQPCKDTAIPQLDPTKLYALVLFLPVWYNPDRNGNRKPVELRIFEQTLAEIKQFGSGFRISQGGGWGHGLRFGGDSDEHIRVEMDALFSLKDVKFLQLWKLELTLRFQQDSVYAFFVGPLIPL